MIFRSLYDTMIKVEVGSSAKQTFDVHQGLLCYHSDYFLNRLDKKSPQGFVSHFTLNDEKPTIFALFFIWMYTGNLMDDNNAPAHEFLSWETLVDAYLFAHRRLARCFRNACIDTLILKMDKDMTDDLASPLLITRVWNDIAEATNPIKRLFAEYFRRRKAALRTLGIEGVMAYPKDLLARVAVARSSSEETLDLWEVRCSFHAHVEGEEDCWNSYGL